MNMMWAIQKHKQVPFGGGMYSVHKDSDFRDCLLMGLPSCLSKIKTQKAVNPTKIVNSSCSIFILGHYKW